MTEEVGAVESGEVTDGAVESAPEAQVNPYAGTKHKVKVNNQELEVPYEELVSGFGINQAAHQKFEAAAKMRKEVDTFIDSLKSGNLRALKELGVPQDKLREFAEQELTEYLEYENLPEADKRRLAAEKERDKYKRQYEEYEQKAKQEQLATLEQQVTSELDSEIGEAIREIVSAEGIDPSRPVEPWFVKHVVDLMISQLETSDDTSQRMTAKAASQRAWKGVENTVKSYLSSVNTDKLLQVLPPEVRDAIRKADVGDAVSQMQTRIRKKQADGSFRPKKKDNRVTTDDFFKRIEQKWK